MTLIILNDIRLLKRKNFLFFVGFVFAFVSSGYGQSMISKPVIDTSVYRKWQTVCDPAISNNGRYVSYIVNNKPLGGQTLVVKSVYGKWKFEMTGGKNQVFTNDGRYLIFMKDNDSLFVLKIGGSVVKKFSNVKKFELKGDNKSEIVSISRDVNSMNVLQLFNVNTGKSVSYNNLKSYILSPDGRNLILFKDSIESNKKIQYLNWIKVETGRSFILWTGTSESCQLIIDNAGKQIASLLRNNTTGIDSTTFLYYKLGNKEPELLFSNVPRSAQNRMQTSFLSRFSKDGSMIFYYTRGSVGVSLSKDAYENVKVWSYSDKKLQSVQDNESNTVRLMNVYNLSTHLTYPIGKHGDKDFENYKNDKGAFLWHIDPNADSNESAWNKSANFSFFVTSTKDGARIELSKVENRYQGVLSPGAKFVVFFTGKDYFSYEVDTRTYRNITNGVNLDWFNKEVSDKDFTTRGIGGWIVADEGVLVYDKYDVWLLDPIGKKPARNITNGIGRRNNIVFSLGLLEYKNVPISLNEKLILSASGLMDKSNGFFEKEISSLEDPKALIYAPYVFHIMDSRYVRENGIFPVKARNANVFLVSRMSATESLNYFVTSDFKKFNPVSNVYPEKSFNWYTSELYTWKSLDRKPLQGILYKPENFDPKKKYPLIIHYYEKLSANLNVYFAPDYSSNSINIPTYVSNGYLVFTPDIEYQIGDPMQGTYNSIVSATHYLENFKYIDKNRIGIQGFSFGGIQTNYLVTNTGLFAAACSGAGLSDFVSGFGTLSLSGNSLQEFYLNGGQNRMEGTPWDMPEMYVKNSAVFKVNKVTTPLLMMHTKNDQVCPFSQALEFFTALRRLNKKVWLLEYKDGMHDVFGKSRVDFDMRMRQFFDHYLKDKPAPLWMLDGVNTIESAFGAGTELNAKEPTPVSGLLTVK